MTISRTVRNVPASLVGPGGLSVHFVTGRRTSRVVTISTIDGRLRGSICSDTTDDFRGPRACRRAPVAQVGETSYRAAVGLARIEEDATVLRWTARSMDLSGGDPVSDHVTASNRKPLRWQL
ncbi:hypothetical protein F4692_002679 [Nocardioides cavernae]|uniref:Uncharacterized protein n=1 Tax=Nocardioides cavernae TaxID=1921566 RepID=A0A7Y9H4K6_9ACTN|nr:hypothetical protein [Nocardioides cavernae]NYE37546.1 hypothetical protein [Nocardioides cavernae]